MHGFAYFSEYCWVSIDKKWYWKHSFHELNVPMRAMCHVIFLTSFRLVPVAL